MANEFIIRNGFQSRGDSQITGSLDVTGGITGSYTGSFTGDGSGLIGVVSSSYAVTASYALNGGGSDTNFANTDLTFTGFRTHDTNGNGFIIASDGVGTSGPYMGMTLQDLGMGLAISSSYIGVSDTDIAIFNSSIQVSVENTSSIIISTSQLNVNAANKDHDVVIEGVTDTSLLVTDASTDRVGIGKNTPSAKLDVNGDTIISGSLTVSGSAHTIDGNTTFNDAIFLNPVSSITSGTLTPNNINRASITVNGTNSVTLADGTQGQLLVLFTSFAVAGTTTVTPTNAEGFSSIQFDAVGDTATLMFMGLDWYLLSSHNVTVS